ncbi:MAG: HNH endonuclease [Comamonadaceae bacterium]|nr:MAG: HNH endonuclease [Comamonadaceae bacterium]
MPSYFFANQGSSIEILKSQQYLFTTNHDRAGRQSANVADLQNMRPGDVVIVNVDGLIALATVKGAPEAYPMQADFAEASNRWDRPRGLADYWRAGMPGVRVIVEYEALPERIRYQDYSADILAAQAQCHEPRQPFSVVGNANMQTFYWLPTPLARVLMRIVGRPLLEPLSNHPEAPQDDTPGPYVAQFAPRETRPEQSAFRDRMIALWKKCPVTSVQLHALLDAAHFTNWRYRNDDAAGMLLNPLIHRAVDRGLLKIELQPNGRRWRVTVLSRDEPTLLKYDRMEFENPLRAPE